MALHLLALGLAAASNTLAIPLASSAPTLLSASAISAFTPFSYYATAAYCTPTSLLAWNCGTNCQANPGFKPVATGGDGNSVQYWYVGYDPTYKAVIVGHEGTNTSDLLPILEDGDIIKTTLSSSLFPGLSSSIEVDQGFAAAQALTAASVLAAVQKTQATYGATTVVTVGHSLGAAIALLDAVYLPLHLPSTTTFKSYLYGLPRVGNPAFAAFVDSAASKTSVTHVNNMKDPVPILPGRFLGFAHPAGEVHIQAPGQWYACPGEDNTASTCEIGDVPNIFVSDESNHDGPYGTVAMGKATCNLNQ